MIYIANKFILKFAIGVDNSPQGEYDRSTGQLEIRVTNSVGYSQVNNIMGAGPVQLMAPRG